MFNIDKALNKVGGSLVATGRYDKVSWIISAGQITVTGA